MKAPWSGQLSAAKTGWLVMLLFFGWLAYLLVPVPKPEPEPTPPPVKRPPSRLLALGLPDNPDLEHLPEFFAQFADKAPWVDDHVEFAYWHPGVRRFEYFFEAVRTNGSYRFSVLPEMDSSWFPTESETWPVYFYTARFHNEQPFDTLHYVGGDLKPKPPMKIEVPLDKPNISPPAIPLNLNSAK